MVEEVIRPRWLPVRTVVSDRYLLANVAYQGHAGGVEVEQVWQVGRVATAGLLPARTFLLDMDFQSAAERISRPSDRMERRGNDYFRRVRDGFLAEAARDPQRIVVIDAHGSVDQVQARIREQSRAVLNLP